MTDAGNDQLGWDENGRLITGLSGMQFYYNWDGKLEDVNDSAGNPLISLLYDPFGNRVYKYSSDANAPAGVHVGFVGRFLCGFGQWFALP